MRKSGASSNSPTQHTISMHTVDQMEGGDSSEPKLHLVSNKITYENVL